LLQLSEDDDDAIVDANLLVEEDDDTKEGRKGDDESCFLVAINGVLGTARKERLP
jgi:hypothetical protein